MIKTCWFTTGRDEEAFILFKDACDAMDQKVIDGEISVLFINREKGESDASDKIITYAKERKIPVESVSSKKFLRERGLTLHEGRILFDREVRSKISGYDFDIAFLAGYMLVVTAELVDSFVMLNLHPSLPGGYKGKWEDVIRNTVSDGRRDFGAMIHMVSADLDEGPAITYVKLALQGREIETLYGKALEGDAEVQEKLFQIMRREEFAIERPLITRTLSLMSQGVIRIKNGNVYSNEVLIEGGIDITAEVTR